MLNNKTKLILNKSQTRLALVVTRDDLHEKINKQ